MLIRFRQDGYTDGAFVSGWFSTSAGAEADGWIDHTSSDFGAQCTRTNAQCELTDFHMDWSGNGLVPAFSQSGLGVFALWVGADMDNMLGVRLDLATGTFEWAGSQFWLNDGSDNRVWNPDNSVFGNRWLANDLVCLPDNNCQTLGRVISNGTFDQTGQPVMLVEPAPAFAIDEPSSALLIVAALVWAVIWSLVVAMRKVIE